MLVLDVCISTKVKQSVYATEVSVTLSRKQMKILVGLLTGHNTLNWHFDFAEDKSGSYVPSLWRRI